ncbi:hypothetical protein [Luteolibacter soli]|uniref:DUF1007 family protein n=1 Tax=Luteolibacter soli TaxID=3135280 RepID=A0ABU9AWQ6_9BACT
MRLLFQALSAALVLLTGGLAHAHGGYETEATVRIYPDRMRIAMTTALPFAWKIMGDQAPGTADADGQAEAKPLLAAMAKTLFKVTADGTPMTPVKSDCVFEVEGIDAHASFSLDFARPTASPVVVEETFFPYLDELDTGYIEIFDHTSAPLQRDIPPQQERYLSLQNPSVTFVLSTPAAANTATTPAPSPAPLPGPTPVAPPPAAERPFPLPIFVAVLLLMAGVIRGMWKRNQKPPAA